MLCLTLTLLVFLVLVAGNKEFASSSNRGTAIAHLFDRRAHLHGTHHLKS